MILNHVIPRVLTGALFTIGGGILALMSLLGGPSFWYVLSLWALIPLGVVWWLCRPSIAAALSVGPLVAVAALLPYVSGVGFVILAGCLSAAVIVVVVALHNSRDWKLPLFISVAFVTGAFCTDRLFTNKVSVKTFQMGVALDGKAPWGEVGSELKGGIAPLVLYRRVGTSYCYVAFESPELRARLAANKGGTVPVEYNVFSDFGSERSYNVRSVDGILLQDRHVVKDAERFSGQILGDGNSTPKCF